jgi:hypothetical protein
MVARWLVVAVAAGCASVPPSPEERTLLEVDETTGRTSTTSDAPMQFTLQFADRGIRMPSSIQLDGVNRVAPGECPRESGIGIGLFPAANASAPGLGGDEGSSVLEVDWAGPTIGRITITWSLPYECVTQQQLAQGESTFTVFPNGRIVRHDIATPSTTTLSVDTNPCGCGAETNFFFTSYWSFTPTPQVMPDGSPMVDGATAGCAVYSNHMIGVAWPDTDTRVLAEPAMSSFVHDWAKDSPTLAPDQREVTSAIMLSEETTPAKCADVIADLDDFPITVAGSQVITDDSGIYLDTRDHSDPVTITTSRRLPRGFAVSLNVGDFAEVTRSPERDDGWFATQDDDGSTVFWFRDGLNVGESITIDPQ